MSGFTAQTMQASSHEASHASAALYGGIRVEWASVDRDHPDVTGWGAIATSFHDNDPRPWAQLYAARAVVSLTALHFETLADIRGADGDVAQAEKWAYAALGPEADGAAIRAWMTARAREVDRLLKDPLFIAAANAISYALLARGTLDEKAVIQAAFNGLLPIAGDAEGRVVFGDSTFAFTSGG